MTIDRSNLIVGSGLAVLAALTAPAAAQDSGAGATLLALYKMPSDTAKFDAYYRDHHGPLAKTLPGLKSYTVSGPLGDPKSPYYFVAELVFASMEAITAALGSSIGKKVVADLPNFAGAGVDIMTYPNKPI